MSPDILRFSQNLEPKKRRRNWTFIISSLFDTTTSYEYLSSRSFNEANEPRKTLSMYNRNPIRMILDVFETRITNGSDSPATHEGAVSQPRYVKGASEEVS